jgi:P27 family predicted phage terminase small subunit
MVRGRKPTPTAITVLHGGKQANSREPKPRQRAPHAPEWLSDEAKEEWRRVVPTLTKLGLLTDLDGAALTVYVEAWSNFVEATKEVSRTGSLVMGPRGSFVRNPAALVAKDSATTLRAFCTEFGLTPSARSRMSVPEGEDIDRDIANILSA